MPYLATNGLPFVEEEEATGEVAEIYEDIKRELQMPIVPNFAKAMGGSPEMLALFWKIWLASLEHRTLPESLSAMIRYTIATKHNCTYCSVSHELTCRTLGVDEETLDNLVKDLGNVNPLRIRAIIEFSLKVADSPQDLVREDYDELRAHGITNAEILEIIMNAAFGVFSDILADAVQLEPESMVLDALEQIG